ncbi:carboxymuconolactone decarboxylase family protein [Azospirillum sp. YIM B02556]|uniref:Carboxymuconolactone decarboxylase family protein n=1 Tax=Azospirillum endophyticum TaxID=2800326 RepID=A0ABS1FB62_9PROT|nr:carboxymuconolactone decarboxylase family protein [Azospirillum endophyticum]MBK1840467.1 carboxymuconolactone decarboxylase family protein [Azospirillum endophyticum]
MDEPLQRAGERVRRDVLGDAYVDHAMAAADDFSRPFQQMVNEYCWGQCWADDALDRRQRSLLNLGMIAALGRMHEFELHLRGAIRNGLSDAELQAALIQIAVYCGIPAGVECFRIARKIRQEISEDGTGGTP